MRCWKEKTSLPFCKFLYGFWKLRVKKRSITYIQVPEVFIIVKGISHNKLVWNFKSNKVWFISNTSRGPFHQQAVNYKMWHVTRGDTRGHYRREHVCSATWFHLLFSLLWSVFTNSKKDCEMESNITGLAGQGQQWVHTTYGALDWSPPGTEGTVLRASPWLPTCPSKGSSLGGWMGGECQWAKMIR